MIKQKMNHTPGQWLLVKGEVKWYIHSDTPDTICELSDGMYSNSSMRNGTMEANACLIAAAPDLLAALKNLIDRDLIKDAYGDHVEEVLAAIEKAEPQ